MENLLLLLVVAVLAVVVLKALKNKRTEESDEGKPRRKNGLAPYFKKLPLSEPEQVIFHRLREALPEQIVLAQVAMPAMVGIRKNEDWRAQFNEISRKYVDFVICGKDFNIAAVVELDDSTHQRGERIKADAVKDVAFQVIGVPVIRFDVRDMPTVEKIQSAFNRN